MGRRRHLPRIHLSWLRVSWLRVSWLRVSWLRVSWLRVSWLRVSWLRPVDYWRTRCTWGSTASFRPLPIPRPSDEFGPEERIEHLLEEIALADTAGLYSFGIGEHHREEFYDSAPPVILGAAAARTSRIRLGSAVTVLSAADPVRVFQQFATLDLISKGRVDLIVGRGSFIEAFPLFGLDLDDYDTLFSEKLELLLKIRDDVHVTWSGRHRPALTGQGVYPRPVQNPLPIWVGVGGTPESFVRAGLLGTTSHGRHHWRRTTTVRSAGESVSTSRCRGRSRT